MRERESQAVDRVVSALAAEASPLRSVGVDAITSFLLGRRVAEIVDVETTVTLLVSCVTADNVAVFINRHARPAWDRHRARSESASEQVGDVIPDAVRRELSSIVEKLRPPPLEWARDAVDPALVRELLAPVLQAALVGFARRLPIPGLGAASAGDDGLAGKLVKGVEARARKLAGVGKSVVGGLGAELDKRIQSSAREFSAEAQAQLRDALRERLASREGGALAARIREQLLERVYQTAVVALMDEVDTLPRRELEGLLGPLLEHNATRELGRRWLEEEVRAFLDIEGARTVRDVLDELGVLAAATTALEARLDALGRELFRTRPFRDFLAAVLTAAEPAT